MATEGFEKNNNNNKKFKKHVFVKVIFFNIIQSFSGL